MPNPLSEGEFYAADALEFEYAELLGFLRNLSTDTKNAYSLIEERINLFKVLTQDIEKKFGQDPLFLARLQEWFRRDSQDIFFQSNLFRRTRTWPEGYPVDHTTLEAIYANEPQGTTQLGKFLDRYFLTRQIPSGIRSRMEKLTQLLNQRDSQEKGKGNWLSLACGPCRELLKVNESNQRKMWCADYDLSTLEYAKELLSQTTHKNYVFQKSNALKLASPERNTAQFGKLTTIYSPGIFDYIEDEALPRLLSGLYASLAPEGTLITSFFDRNVYDTFDTHWLSRWTSFHQRDKDQALRLLTGSEIPMTHISLERDESGTVVFLIAKK